jgi:hypothetical protein
MDLERRFVCVRITAINDVDLALFQFDYDLTWMGFFLSADNRIYSRYGGRDATSDEGRLSVKGLKATMLRVLDAHRQPARTTAVAPKPVRPHELFAVNRKACLHCHQVWEGLRSRQRKEGTFDLESLHVYPLPENIGVELDVHDGRRVVKVLPGLSAERAGVRVGDELRRVADVSILSQADVQWALHRAPAKGTLAMEVLRQGRVAKILLTLAPGWRRTDTSWRESMAAEAKRPK